MQIQADAKGRNEAKVTTASDTWMSILERCFLNPVFWKRAKVGLRCFVLNDESADVPEDIAVDWSLPYPATDTPRNPFSVWTILLCIAVWVCSGVQCYIAPNSQIPRGRPSLLYDHTNVILMVVV